MARKPVDQKSNLVCGRVADKLNRPLAKLIVQAFHKDMRSEELLGESITDRKGVYEITWQQTQLSGKSKNTADIGIKVYTPEKKTLLFATDTDGVRFNASAREEINITISTAIKPEAVEYDHVLKEVISHAKNVAVTDLQENDQHQDITFLAKEAEIPPEKIEHLAVAHRLQAESGIDAAFFYALLRKNTLLKNDIAKPLQARLVIDINTDIIPLLYDAVLTDAKTIQRDVASAVKDMIISENTSDKCAGYIKQLQKYKQKAEEYYKNEHPQKVLEHISRFVLEDKIGEMERLFRKNKNNPREFLQQITDSSFFGSAEKATEKTKDAGTYLALGELVGFDEAIISQVKNLQKIEKPEDVKKLAALNKAGWKEVLTKSADKIVSAGRPLDKKLIDLQASSLARKMEKEFPTAAFTAQLGREKKTLYKNQEAIKDFLTKHDDFDLQKNNIDLFLKEKNRTVPHDEAMRDELKSIQRVFKLVPHYSKTNALLMQNIRSAQSIFACGETRFVKEIAPKAGIKTKEAREIFRKAERTHTAAMLLAGELQDTIRSKDIPALEMKSLVPKIEEVSKDFPNLKSLFKLTDACECESCRSVYSPAAYLVEILQFLHNRSVVDLTVPAPPPPAVRPSVKIAKDVLFERRPDLGEIDLGCANAMTPVPYIDLVCELLEEAVAPDKGIPYTGPLSGGLNPLRGKVSNALLAALQASGIPVTGQAEVFETETGDGAADDLPHYLRDDKAVCKIVKNTADKYTIYRLRQTLAPAEELDAAPEYVNTKAYEILANQKYAFRLPFDLSHTEGKAYFSRFDIARAELMEDFQHAGDPAEAIATEKLGLTAAERQLIVKPRPTIAGQKSYWNPPSQWDDPPVSGDVVKYMSRVDHFLDKTGITYKELDLLLSLTFIDPDKNLFIKHDDLSSDTAKKEINLDIEALDRIHRFLRLQKKTRWKFRTLDEIISQDKLGRGKLDDECLIKMADMLKLSEETGIKLDELIGFFGQIPHQVFPDGTTSLYQQIFLNKARNGFIDEGLLPEKADGSPQLNDRQTSLSVCLQLSQQDFEILLTILPDGTLTFANLSYLFAASALMRKLKLKATDFSILVKLTGINLQDSPRAALKFVKAVKASASSPLKPDDVRFLLRHEASNLEQRELKDESIKLVLEKIQADLQKTFTANRSLYNQNLAADEQRETLQNLLAKLKGISEEDVKQLIRFIRRDWTLVSDIKNVVNSKLSTVYSPAQITVLINTIDALETASGPDYTSEQDDLVTAFIHVINASAVTTGLTLNEKKVLLQNLLSAVSVLTEEEAVIIIQYIEFNRISAGDAKSFIEDKLGYEDKANNIIREGFLTAEIKTGIDNLWTATNSSVDARRKELAKAYFDAVAAYQFRVDRITILEKNLAAAFKSDNDQIKTILQYAKLKQPVPGAALISDLLLAGTLIDTDLTHNNPVLPLISEQAFPNQYRSLRLLHKLIPLVNSLKLDNRETAWFLENNAALTWFELDGIPYQTGHSAVAYQKYTAFTGMLSLAKKLTPVPNPADAENPITFRAVVNMLLPGSTAARDEFIAKFSLLTAYLPEDVDAVDAYLFPAFNLNNYRDIETWKAVERCVGYLRKLGGDISLIKEIIKPVLTGDDTKQLRMALKARYDEETWLSTLKEIMDAIRPQKRRALVAYLLAVNPGIKDEKDLYDYFLVDVEMESGMSSSRIVQAHGTVQLFVQRCLMGLEPGAAADVDNDKGWEQWKWMRNYRVWEANRKVFLYPENWIEAELRDDKSFLFAELENELMQNELNEFTAEEALIKYMGKLDNIAFLEVLATWYQADIKTMHVFARTKGGDPSLYYYRRLEQERTWTPWEKVELDITGNQLLAFGRNNRLCLAWPVFSEDPDPNPQATVPDGTQSTVTMDKPKRKLKIQLAVSEYANKKWQPKKLSKDAIDIPSGINNYTVDDLPRDRYNLMYFAMADQVWLFCTDYSHSQESHNINGIFNIAGCKGYPELVPNFQEFTAPDFLPDFRDTLLWSQRYYELDMPPDDLAVKNAISMFQFYEILRRTPEFFRITYPHQFTLLDLVVFLIQFMLKRVHAHSEKRMLSSVGLRSLKIPLGTLLPYFMEDSSHAYVIIPGFYKKTKEIGLGEAVLEKRTGSDVLQLIEDLIDLALKYIQKYQEDPAHDIEALKAELVADEDFQDIKKRIIEFIGLRYGEQFKNMYHPLVCQLRKTLYKDGVAGLMKRETQLQQNEKFDFEKYYLPNAGVVPKTYVIKNPPVDTISYPVEDLDFSTEGSYSCYNWELFFHVPFMIATRLTKNQRFEEALTWFHYMFNPTGALPGTTPQKYWVTKPFFQTHDSEYINQRIDTLLYKTANQTTPEIAELEFAIEQWRLEPFKPHVVARLRPVAYQKALLMKYIDNLTEWGDYLFRQDTMESIVQATQMYILADKLLGPKPRVIPPVVKAPYETYNQIEGRLDAFGNALIDLENILPDLSVLPEGGVELPPPSVTLSMLYFCIPRNDKMLEYWDRIADRLFKIRHCQNIDGVERSLALFAPPIDPGMLVRAAATGLDISAVIAGLNAPTPYYRFNAILPKATELAQEVRGLGASLLQALEKKDAEAMSLLRSELEIKVLNAVKDLKLLQIKEAKEQIEILQRTKAVTEERNKYYSSIQRIIANEQLNLDKLSESQDYQTASQIVRTIAGALALIPEMHLGANGFGGSPEVVFQIGGSALSKATNIGADILNILSSVASYEANRASILASYDRRYDDWKLQERLSKKELAQIEKQITAAEIRKEISETDLKNHELQIENANKTDEFMRSKFTNKELYEWMIGQISSVYFRAYQLAHDFAKKAERSYQFELGNDDTFIQYGYWDSMKKGLQSADHLIHDLKRMETSYLDKNKREYEITKHVSLVMLDPLALIKLRATGSCDFSIPETLFDMDHAGHYFRRIKSVSISMPCITGPFTSVSAKLSLVSNKYRKNTNPGEGYGEDPGNDERFVYNIGAIQSIAASSSQNDSGVFELNFRDERYLPFEGAGAISSWRLELPGEVRQFDYNTISDVVLHLKYTAREGGSTLKGLAETSLKDRLAEIKQQLNRTGLHVAISMKHDLPNEWHLLKKNGTVDLKIDKSRLPYMAQTIEAAIENVMFVAKAKDNPASFSVSVDGNTVNLARIDAWELCRGNNAGIGLDTSFELSVPFDQLYNLDELMMVVKYSSF